jgi:hypothetical protein
MNIDYFNEYLDSEAKGLKTKAKECVNKFIRSFENYSEKESWTMEYLSTLEMNRNGRVRNELFEEIIFPVLLDGYNRKNVFLMVWLAKLNQNYHQNHRIWEKMDYRTEVEIVMECYDLEPDNNAVTDLLLELMVNELDFNMHEWPPYILFGNSAATKDECKILLDRTGLINKLDRNKKYSAYIRDCEDKIREYMEREQ